MQNAKLKKTPMNVPNWLIALELCSGAVLLYISSSALIGTDMHLVNRNQDKKTELLQSSLPNPSTEMLMLSINTTPRHVK